MEVDHDSVETEKASEGSESGEMSIGRWPATDEVCISCVDYTEGMRC